MSKKIFALTVVLVSVGCASAPLQSYRPANYSGSSWSITGTNNINSVIIKINNQTVIEEKLSFIGGDGEFRGSYEGKPVTASCSTNRGIFFGRTVNCIVFVSGDRAATLKF